MKKMEHEPGMLRDLFFIARSKHIGFDPFLMDSLVLTNSTRTSKKTRVRLCSSLACGELACESSRNDARFPLCQKHKKGGPVLLFTGTFASFCFYCNKLHETSCFTMSKKICDRSYLRKRKIT